MKQYQFVQELGSGSFGRVIKAFHLYHPNQFVAIKLIKMTALNQKEKYCAINEIRLLASIKSPNVISYHTAFYDQPSDHLCIVMEFADGGDLAKLISKKRDNRQKFNENFIWQVAYSILKALKILHTNKIIHRDLKPGNILFVDGVAKLGDMNLSKVMQGNFACTQAGTPYYTSPQIWNGELYDGKCDIWSLGCLLYEIAVLRPPFTANDFPSLIKKVNTGLFDPIPVIYSKRLSQVIKHCLRVRMLDRPSAIDLLQDSVFHFIQHNEEGTVNLLNTIKCSRILKLIQQKLLKKVEERTQEEIFYRSPSGVKKFVSEEKYKFRDMRINNDLIEKENNALKSRSKNSINKAPLKSASKGISYRMAPVAYQPRPRLTSPNEYYIIK